MFYFNYLKLCNKVNKSPSAVAEEMGFKRSVVTRWSKGTVPRDATLQKIANYFGVEIKELTGKKEKPADQLADGLTEEEIEYIKWYREAPESIKEAVRLILNQEGK